MIKNKYNYIIAFIFSVISYFNLCLQNTIETYSVLSLILFIFMYYFYVKINILDIASEQKKESAIISIIISSIIVIGSCLYGIRYNPNISFINQLFTIKNIINLIGTFSLIFGLMIFLMPRLIKCNLIKNSNISSKKIFWLSFGVLLVAYLPYFIIYYPGILTSDSISEISMVINKGLISEHHTILHYIFINTFYRIGYFLTNNQIIAVSLVSFIQMIIMICITSYLISFLNSNKINKKVLFLIIIFYAIIPVFPIYSITMWKDVLFSGCVILFLIECLKIFSKKDKLTIKDFKLFIIISLLVLFFRNNAVYAYMLFSICILIILRKKIKIVLPVLLIVFSTYLIIKGPIYSYFNIQKSSSAEYISIPLQQIGRMAYKNVDFTAKEEKTINKLISVDKLKELYNPEIVDSIKFSESFNINAFNNNKIEYLNLWFSLCIKNFDIAVESYLISTLGYWYPNVDYWSMATTIEENDFNIVQIIPNYIRKPFSYVTSKRIPIIGLFFSCGFCIWIMFFGLYLSIKKSKKIYSYIFPITIWITMMIAAPVFAEYRYIYCITLSLPIFLLIPYLNKNIY